MSLDIMLPHTMVTFVKTDGSDDVSMMIHPSTPDQSTNRVGKRLVCEITAIEPEARKSPRSSPKSSSSNKKVFTSSSMNGSTSGMKRSGLKSSDFRGVSKCAKDGRWQSRIRVGKKVKYLGRFKTEEAAAARYDEAALALHGRRATLNFELSELELEKLLANIAGKRAEFGFDASDVNESYSPRAASSAPSSRSTSRSTSPSHTEEEDSEDPTADDQSAAWRLMWLKLSLAADPTI